MGNRKPRPSDNSYYATLSKLGDFRVKQMPDIVGEDIDLKVASKKLASGKCQVKFYAKMDTSKNIYGYTLVEPQATLKEVVNTIKAKLRQTEKADTYYHGHLYNLGKKQDNKSIFMIFKSESGRTQV